MTATGRCDCLYSVVSPRCAKSPMPPRGASFLADGDAPCGVGDGVAVGGLGETRPWKAVRARLNGAGGTLLPRSTFDFA